MLKFDLSQLRDTAVEKATLKLHVRNIDGDSSQTVNVSVLADNDWSETGITWNTLPASKSSNATLTVSSEQKKQWVELDVTELVNNARSEGAIGLLLENSGLGFVAFGSDETDQIPELDIKRAL
ncbi:DNRLRE domain-containing protein [Vibrio natriegens]|uniref:DNRLRE domain-containing protein n=1 Tax=Vibrio natriegens TaxID=691 RepID=UPI0021E75486|nr:DNRLRE domain-containing protein [Vibrio natriegens]UYI46265.1 DNRLRE domain-containing protein [Vibrio natriegens]